MEPWTVVIVLAALVAVSTALGLLYRLTRSRVGTVAAAREAAVDGIDLGSQGTLLQFSSAVCSACAATRRILESVSTDNPSLRHVEVDVTDRPDLVSRFNILQTPTTLILDHTGVPVSRIGGGVRREVVLAQLTGILTPAPTPKI